MIRPGVSGQAQGCGLDLRTDFGRNLLISLSRLSRMGPPSQKIGRGLYALPQVHAHSGDPTRSEGPDGSRPFPELLPTLNVAAAVGFSRKFFLFSLNCGH